MTQPLPVTQAWTHVLPLMQQTVLLTAIRGPDGVAKYHPVKFLLRWFRRCVLLSAFDRAALVTPFAEGGGSFTGKSVEPGAVVSGNWNRPMDLLVDEYLRSLDELPHHFQMHFLHASEILGYKHPDPQTRTWWRAVYRRLVNDLHLHPESVEDLDRRLGDGREEWLASADSATAD